MNLHHSLARLALASLLTMTAAGAMAHDTGTHGPGAHDTGSLTVSVRKANDRFRDVKVAAAEGYAPIPCASGTSGGAMGIHYVNADYLKDDAIDISKPEAVMYEPKANGEMQLVAVEYITEKGPASLEGQLFNFNSAPNRYGLPAFYELHVWAWRENPTGAFSDNNPRCLVRRREDQRALIGGLPGFRPPRRPRPARGSAVRYPQTGGSASGSAVRCRFRVRTSRCDRDRHR